MFPKNLCKILNALEFAGIARFRLTQNFCTAKPFSGIIVSGERSIFIRLSASASHEPRVLIYTSKQVDAPGLNINNIAEERPIQ
jgi:hypothetical protein